MPKTSSSCAEADHALQTGQACNPSPSPGVRATSRQAWDQEWGAAGAAPLSPMHQSAQITGFQGPGRVTSGEWTSEGAEGGRSSWRSGDQVCPGQAEGSAGRACGEADVRLGWRGPDAGLGELTLGARGSGGTGEGTGTCHRAWPQTLSSRCCRWARQALARFQAFGGRAAGSTHPRPQPGTGTGAESHRKRLPCPGPSVRMPRPCSAQGGRAWRFVLRPKAHNSLPEAVGLGEPGNPGWSGLGALAGVEEAVPQSQS